MCVRLCCIVPVSDFVRSQHPSESNVDMSEGVKYRHVLHGNAFRIVLQTISLSLLRSRPALFSAARILHANENGARLETRLQFNTCNFTPSIKYSV